MAEVMATRLDVVMIGKMQVTYSAWKDIVVEINRLHALMNRFDENSYISLINKQAAIKETSLSDEFFNIIVELQQYHRDTLGYFDITLGYFDKVVLNEEQKTIFFKCSDMFLDLGGYAKGYALEQIRKILITYNIEHALINFGNSSILALGEHPFADHWAVTVEDIDVPNKNPKIYKMRNQALSTSGNNTARNQHIINPHTQTKIASPKIISVISDNAIEAEILSTALIAAPETEILKIESIFGNDAIFTSAEFVIRQV
jgi:thiamine biosynthesis lipoprotein